MSLLRGTYLLVFSKEINISLLDLVNIQFLQNMQDFFAQTMDVASLVIDEKGPVTKPSNFCRFCTDCLRNNAKGVKRCNKCDIHWSKVAAKKGTPVVYQCHAGLTDFAVPIMIENHHVASILGGQILTEKPNECDYIKLARELKIDEEECLTKIREVKIVSEEKLQATIDFLYQVANAISAVFYANYKLSKLNLSYKPARKIELENWFFSQCQKLPVPITEREFEVLKLIVQGKSNTEIAKELFISVHTAKAHVSSILEKLLVEDRVQLAVKATKEGLI